MSREQGTGKGEQCEELLRNFYIFVPKEHVFYYFFFILSYLKNKAKTEGEEEYKAYILNFIKSVLAQICEKKEFCS